MVEGMGVGNHMQRAIDTELGCCLTRLHKPLLEDLEGLSDHRQRHVHRGGFTATDSYSSRRHQKKTALRDLVEELGL